MQLSRIVLLAMLVCLMVSQGCRRKPSNTSAAPASEEASASLPQSSETAKPRPGSPVGKPGAEQAIPDRLPTAPNDSALRFPIQQELTGAIHLYSMDKQKMPADFETLVKEKYLKAMPKAPPGKRFALDRNRMQVVILD